MTDRDLGALSPRDERAAISFFSALGSSEEVPIIASRNIGMGVLSKSTQTNGESILVEEQDLKPFGTDLPNSE